MARRGSCRRGCLRRSVEPGPPPLATCELTRRGWMVWTSRGCGQRVFTWESLAQAVAPRMAAQSSTVPQWQCTAAMRWGRVCVCGQGWLCCGTRRMEYGPGSAQEGETKGQANCTHATTPMCSGEWLSRLAAAVQGEEIGSWLLDMELLVGCSCSLKAVVKAHQDGVVTLLMLSTVSRSHGRRQRGCGDGRCRLVHRTPAKDRVGLSCP